MHLKKVLLPAPDGPIITTFSFFLTSKLIPFKSLFIPFSLSTFLNNSLTFITFA